MSESVFMSAEIADTVDISDKLADKLGPIEPEHYLFAVLIRDGKKSKRLKVGRYSEDAENGSTVRKLELFLTHQELLSVAQNRPDGFVLFLGEEKIASRSTSECARLFIDAVGAPSSLSHVWLMF